MPIIRRTRLFNAVSGVCLQHHTLLFFPVLQANTPRSIKQSCSPDDGHNDAQNMLTINQE